METFGEWLRRQRQQLRLTREQLAERVGCSVALLRKIEDGERRPSTQIAELLANALNVPSVEQATFVKVARGELSAFRLPQTRNETSGPDVSSAAAAFEPPINLPVPPTPLIGRQREVGELRNLLRIRTAAC
jgi:transcriptional regulator with XRE-family HTH domain